MAQIGVCFVSVRDTGVCDTLDCWPLVRGWYREAGLRLLKAQLPHWATTDPRDVLDAVEDGVQMVILCSNVEGGLGYSPSWLFERIEQPSGLGIAYRTVCERVVAYGGEVWIEVGNEPDLNGVDPRLASSRTVRLVKLLRPRWPWARWAASMPTRLEYYDAFLTNDLLSTIDGVATHLYGGRELGDAAGGDWGAIYRRLLDDARVRQILVTEAGIEDRSIPYEEKARVYRQFALDAPAKVRGVAVFTFGRPGRWAGGAWDGYCLHTREHLMILGGKVREETEMGVERYRIRDLVDRRTELHRNPNGGPRRSVPLSRKRGVIVHYNGPEVMNYQDSATAWRVVQANARYHCERNWAAPGQPPVQGDGLMYHIVVGPNGEKWLCRDLEAVLWHCGSWPENETHVAVQCPLGGDQRATPAQLQALREVVDDLRALLQSERAEVKGHQEVSRTNCPGTLMQDFVLPYRLGEERRMADGVRFAETGKYLGGGFYRYWLEFGGLPVFGFPISEEYRGPVISGCGCREDGQPHVVQWFERARFEWHPGLEPERYDVLLGRVGAELAERLGIVGTEPFRRQAAG